MASRIEDETKVIVLPGPLMGMPPGSYESTVYAKPASAIGKLEEVLIEALQDFRKTVEAIKEGKPTDRVVGIIPANPEHPTADFKSIQVMEAVDKAAQGIWDGSPSVNFLVAGPFPIDGPQVDPRRVRGGAIASALLMRSRLARVDQGTQQVAFAGNVASPRSR